MRVTEYASVETLLARDAPRLERAGASSARASTGSTCCARPSRPARSRARRRCARWRSSTSSRRCGAGPSAAARATSTTRATWTSRSRSAPCSCTTARSRCRRAAGIVADSDPRLEYLECENKARALIQAIDLAREGERLMLRLLMIDNYDSFTYNLVQYLGELGAEVEVVRNDAEPLAALVARGARRRRDLARARAGPRTRASRCPRCARSRERGIPLLGVCLGHQAHRRGVRRTRGARAHADARQDVGDPARRARRVRGASRARSRPRATTPW